MADQVNFSHLFNEYKSFKSNEFKEEMLKRKSLIPEYISMWDDVVSVDKSLIPDFLGGFQPWFFNGFLDQYSYYIQTKRANDKGLDELYYNEPNTWMRILNDDSRYEYDDVEKYIKQLSDIKKSIVDRVRKSIEDFE